MKKHLKSQLLMGLALIVLSIILHYLHVIIFKDLHHTMIFLVADIIKQWPCTDECADLVVCNLVLEHIEDLSFVFSEAFRSLNEGGRFFFCELHPFRQYQGTKARFQRNQETMEIQAFVHHISDYLETAEKVGLTLKGFKEWWHEEDQDKPPRLVSFMFEK